MNVNVSMGVERQVPRMPVIVLTNVDLPLAPNPVKEEHLVLVYAAGQQVAAEALQIIHERRVTASAAV